MVDGKSYSITIDHKPTQREAQQLIRDKIDKSHLPTQKAYSFGQCANDYMSAKLNVLSPTTIRGYKAILRGLPGYFTSMSIYDIDAVIIQKVINEISSTHTPKTTRNVHGFIASVLGMYRPNFVTKTTLPQKIKQKKYIPTTEDVQRVLDYFKGTDYHIVMCLGAYGLRRSEAISVTADDIKGGVLHIGKAKVLSVDSEWIEKTTKTVESTRDVPIPKWLCEEIKAAGVAYKYHPCTIMKKLHKAQDDLNIPRFEYHKLRHYFASKLSLMGVPDAQILALGGWSTDNVMKTIYRHDISIEDEKRRVLENFDQDLTKK